MTFETALAGRTVAILVATGFAEAHTADIQRALLAAGATVRLISPDGNLVNGWLGGQWGHYFPTDAALSGVLSADYDIAIVPGGARAVTKLGREAHTARILRGFLDAAKPVLLVDEAVELLAQLDRARGLTVTGAERVREAVEAAGGTWSDAPFHADGLVMSAQGGEEIATDTLNAILDAFIAWEPAQDADAA